MDHEIELAPFGLEFIEHRIDGRDILDIAGHHQRGADAFGERPDALAERLTLIGEGQFGPMLRQHLRDAPGNRILVGDAHDEAAFSLHEDSHEETFRIVIFLASISIVPPNRATVR